MAFKDNFQKFIESQVEAALDLIFANAHSYAMSTSGDITPEQKQQLEEIEESLRSLVYEQVVQNIPNEEKNSLGLPFDDYPVTSTKDSEQEPPMKDWNVPVCRIGYGHALMAVSARTEEEAIAAAIEAAGDEEFSEKTSEYTAPDGAHEII